MQVSRHALQSSSVQTRNPEAQRLSLPRHTCFRSTSPTSHRSLQCPVLRPQHTNLQTTDARGEKASTSHKPEIVDEGSGASTSESAGLWQNLAGRIYKTAAVGVLCLAMVCAAVNPAWAARSGGRVGGSAFSSGGLGSGIGRTYGGSSLAGSSMFGGSMRSPGLQGLSRRGPSVSINSFGWYSPFGYGYGYGAPVVAGGGGGSGLGAIIVLGILAAVLFSFFANGDDDEMGGGGLVTVAKLQVGLLSNARDLKRKLDRIAGRADTNSPDGLHYILQETVLALLRNPDYAIYGAATTSNQRNLEKGESKFNQLSMEERGKFKEETLVNYDGRTRRSTYSGGSSANRGSDELIVVTILVAVDGGIKLPKVTSLEELRSALNALGSVGSDQVLACEVLWTPQDEGDYYSKDEIFQDYPTLNNL